VFLLNHPLARFIPRRFIVFGMVGTAGFLVDVSVLETILYSGGGYYMGQAVAFFVAATMTWFLNRTFTFRDRKCGVSGMRQWLIYTATMLVGFTFNYGVYVTLISSGGIWKTHVYLAVAAGTIAGLCFNFPASKYFVFRAAPALPEAPAGFRD
jgi:putative flippase GtrA